MSIASTLELIEPYIHRTPVMTSRLVDEITGARLFFKCENFQRMGAFKMRGAMSAVLNLDPAVRGRGVVTHSSGNFAQALSLAAREVGIPAYIVMPSNSPAVKRAAVIDYGGIVTECEPTQAARQATAAEITARTGATFIHPYNDMDVIMGQGTAAWELLEECPDLDYIVSPVGGGGLVSGTILAAQERARMERDKAETNGFTNAHDLVRTQAPADSNMPDTHCACKVIGAEPAAMDDAARSLLSGKIESNPVGAFTIADGLRTTLGDKTFAIIYGDRQGRDSDNNGGCATRCGKIGGNYTMDAAGTLKSTVTLKGNGTLANSISHNGSITLGMGGIDSIVTVSEQDIMRAMKLLWERMKIVVEPSGAVPLAAVLTDPDRFRGKRTGLIISGGNVDFYN